MFRKKSRTILFLFVLISCIPMIASAVEFNQFITLKDDGAGSLKLVYSEKEALLTGKTQIGNLPFDKAKMNEFFSTEGVQVGDVLVDKNQKDASMTQYSVSVNFDNVTKLNNLKGLAGIKYGLAKTDSGNVFTINIALDFFNNNSINQAYSVLYIKGEFKSANGAIKDKSVAWFRSKDKLEGKPVSLYATLRVINTPNKNNPNTNVPGGNQDSDKGKSCGLFGIELPFVILLGTLFIRRRRNNLLK